MMHSNLVLSPTPPVDQDEPISLSNYALIWRRQVLIVTDASDSSSPALLRLSNHQHLVTCLQHSPIKLVRLDLALGSANLKAWADATEQAHKAVFLRIPSNAHLPQKRSPVSWWLKRSLEWLAAVALLLLLAPVILGLGWFMRMQGSGGGLTSDWCVGERGQLFRRLKFWTSDLENRSTSAWLSRWMQQLNLDQLPQLWNVVRGEMSLVGPRLWTLEDVVQVEPALQYQLNVLPGMIGTWRVEANCDVNAVNQADLTYLQAWSLLGDLKILVQVIPKALARTSAD